MTTGVSSRTTSVASKLSTVYGALGWILEPRIYCSLAALSLLLIAPMLVGSPFVIHIVVTICVFAGLSTAWNIVGGYAGQLSLGHTVFYGIGAYTTALLIQHLELIPWLGMLVGAGLSVLVAVGIGYPCFRLRGPFFALATIAFLEVVRLLAIHFHSFTGGAAGLIVPLRLGWTWMIFQDKFNYLCIAFALLLLTLAISCAIRHSRLGYYLIAVREREDAASAAGVDNTSVKLRALMISAALTSLIGSFHAMYLTFLEPATMFSLATAIEIAMFSLIGGLGTVAGPLLGTVLVVPIAEAARGWLGASANGLHGFVYGTVLVLMTLMLPGGLAGTLGAAVGRFVDRFPGSRVRKEEEAPPVRRISGSPREPVLQTSSLVKRFGGLTAIDSVSITVSRGEILGIIGPNGAGKTTLFNLMSGFLKPTSGLVTVTRSDGRAVTPSSPHEYARLGVGRTFQIVQPFGGLTVIENIMIGAFMRHRGVEAARAAALHVARIVGLHSQKDVEASHLTIGDLKRLEVARALATEPSILLLDEVMAGQNQAEAKKMIETIRAIRNTGVTVVAIEHNMQAIMSLSDRVVVIDSGKVIAEGRPKEIVRNRRVIEAYLGEDFVDAQGL
jgi:branched-chain amino acid transport system permease protein